MSGEAEALAGAAVGEVPGSPGGVRALADSWRSAARTVTWGADLADSARTTVSSCRGMSADACREAARGLTRDLEGTMDCLLDGAGVLEDYAGVLDEARTAIEELRRQATATVQETLDNPSAAPEAAGALAPIMGAAAGLRAKVDLAAHLAAAALTSLNAGGQQAGAGGAGNGASESDNPFTRLWKRNFEHRPEVNSKRRLTTEDVNRIKEQDEGGVDWRTVDQQAIGDCFLLATLQAYSQSEDGQQLLRDNIRLNDARDGFIVTLYDNGQPVDVNVTDYYTNGLQGQQTAPPTLLNIYERSYGLYFGGQNLARGGKSETAMERISNREPDRIDTRGGTGATFWSWWDDNTYSDSEWQQIEQAIDDDRPVVASSPKGGIVSDDNVDADTNNDGVFDAGSGPGAEDQGGGYRIAGDHVYTVESIDDEYVTLINPWGNNPDASDTHVGSGGRIRITREEYATYFPSTDVGRTS